MANEWMTSVGGQFQPIPDHLLPPGMRNGGIARDFARELIAQHEAGGWVDPARLAAAKAVLRRAEEPSGYVGSRDTETAQQAAV